MHSVWFANDWYLPASQADVDSLVVAVVMMIMDIF